MALRDDGEVESAWRAWEQLQRLSDLLWDRYWHEFLERCEQREDDGRARESDHEQYPF